MAIRPSHLETVAARVLGRLPPGVAGDVRVRSEGWTTMRFANGHVHQPHVEESRSVSLRVAKDQRLGIATTTDTSPAGLARVVRDAVALASIAPVDHRVGPFPADGHARPVPYSRATAALVPEAVGRLAERALESARADDDGFRVSGAVHAGTQTLAVANTSGRSVSGVRTASQASVLVERPADDPPVSGWAEGSHWDAGKLDTAALGAEALARMPRDAPKAAKPGSYRVLLGGAAAQEMIAFLGHLGFSGHGEEEGWSCLKSKRGKRFFPEELTLADDGRSPLGLPNAFDEEGTPKRRLALIDRGVVGPAVTDLVTAGHLGSRLTGHALPPESPYGEWGPVPTSLVLRSKEPVSDEELAQLLGNGLIVTRFHYVRIVHPARGVITGMTRDGTYRVRRGEIVGPVRNLRFTQSVLDALRATEAVGRTRHRFSDERGVQSVTCPALVTAGFRFTSATVF
ncbi:MAG TPA: TldD/PmbA family protein [Thermoplasmata archaeon]|jgi:predicted Zn-dependent protease|nr:TldD/PmbA family protein [Thermoplasmata archaeon]